MTDNEQAGPKPVVKMIDLARLAGVSKSTVSRALADSPLIPKDTRERIQALARTHNYRLNKKARNFRTKETLTIAVLIPDTQEKDWRLSDPFFLELLGSIADTLNDQNHELLLAKTSMRSEDWVGDHVKRGTCDGVILVGQGTQHAEINAMADGSTPFVVWGGLLPDQRYCTVGSDNRLGGEKATAHLIERGRRRIAFFGDRRLPEVGLRYEGYVAAHKAAGLEILPDLEVTAPFSGSTAFDAIADFLKGGVDIDAIFACSDVIAMATVRALGEQGLSIPKDVAVVGYDDISLAAYYSPPLTTVRQDTRKGGEELVKRLLRLIQGGEATPLMLETDLIVRASTGGVSGS